MFKVQKPTILTSLVLGLLFLDLSGLFLSFTKYNKVLQNIRYCSKPKYIFNKVEGGGGGDVPLFETIKTNAGTQPKI